MKKPHLPSLQLRKFVPGRRYHGVQGKVVHWVEHTLRRRPVIHPRSLHGQDGALLANCHPHDD